VAGRALPPTSRFAGDDGAADPALAAALARLAVDPDGGLAAVVAALAGARVLVPVVAVEHADEEGAAHEGADACAAAAGPFAEARHASAGVVAVAAPDGRRALPVFSSVDALAAWHPDARPMPAEGPRAAAAAVQEGWALLVVDPGGPVTAVVPRPAVHALASGAAWRPAVAGGAVRAEVADAVGRALRDAAGVRSVRAEPGRGAEVAVVLAVAPGLTRAGLDAVLGDVRHRLAAADDVTAAVDSLELRVVSAGDA